MAATRIRTPCPFRNKKERKKGRKEEKKENHSELATMSQIQSSTIKSYPYQNL
jgi:hypothetical protein